jgi:lipopolysaccharide/colanic/teichoic acid biosynthesis glycosyltransferase
MLPLYPAPNPLIFRALSGGGAPSGLCARSLQQPFHPDVTSISFRSIDKTLRGSDLTRRYLAFLEFGDPSGAPSPISPLNPTAIRFQAWRGMMPTRPRAGDRVRRVINIVIALILIVLAAPLMLLIALLVRLTSKGPVIYTQPRVGLDRRRDRGDGGALNPRRIVDLGGRIFTIYKFRTMYVSPPDAPQKWAGENDPRITPLGRILRSFRLDELPQLFNVLKGEMNIVGPRPEQPEIFANLHQDLRHYRVRQRVLPGITGLAQVSLPYDSDIGDVQRKVKLDLEYIRRRSPAEDLLIMARTMPVMVLRKGWK